MSTSRSRTYPGNRLALAAAMACLACVADPAAAQSRTDTLAITGQTAPGAGLGVTFSVIGGPTLNSEGQTVFLANLTGGTSRQGLYRTRPGGELTAIALEGQSATGAGAGTFLNFPGASFNDAGQTAFLGLIIRGTSTSGIYRSSGSTLTAIALEGQNATGAGAGKFSGLVVPALNGIGQTAFEAQISGGTSTSGIYRSSNDSTLTAIALQGQNATGAGAGTLSDFSNLQLNDAGQTAFVAGITGGTSISGIYRSDSGSALTAIALQGQSAAGAGSGTFSVFRSLVLNDVGQTAFSASITGGTSTDGIYRSSSGSALTAIALEGQSATGAGAGIFARIFDPVLNNAGQTAFLANITGGDSTQGIYRSSSGSALTAIALQGQSATGAGSGTFSGFGSPVMNDAGLLSFSAGISGGTSTQGLYLGDGRETVAVQLQGAVLVGKTVASSSRSSQGLNRHGQLAYTARFTDGTAGAFLFTPALRWRSTTSGGWDDTANWTLSLNPADVHDVTLDPTNSLTITGPTGAVTLKSLRVGTGSGLVTLQMAGGAIDAADPVLIGPRGMLSGTGSFSRLVINQGTVQADQLVMSESLSNAGLVRGVGGGPRAGAGLNADLLNQASGRVLVQPGETLQLQGTSHRNRGVFEINQGRLEMAGTLLNDGGGVIDLNRSTALAAGAWTNAAGARLLLGDARLTVSGGLSNAGQVLVTSGDSDVFGAVVNQSGGQILLSGQGTTTFYDAVEAQQGSELRVSGGATAVFFGAVQQRNGALFSGSGRKYYEGGFSVGNSPGAASDGGDVTFGLGNLYLAELGGTEPGAGFDHYNVAGTLTLGGELQIVSWDGFTGQAGQSFDLFDWGQLQGQFGSVNASGLQLAEGTYLDLSRLYVDGTISVTAVPEPATWALWLGGLLAVGFKAGRGRSTTASA